MSDTYFHFEIPVSWHQAQRETIKAETNTFFFKEKAYVLEFSIDNCDTLSAEVGAATCS